MKYYKVLKNKVNEDKYPGSIIYIYFNHNQTWAWMSDMKSRRWIRLSYTPRRIKMHLKLEPVSKNEIFIELL